MLTRALLVFVVAVALDAIWTLYIRRSGEGKAWAAGFWAALMLVVGVFNTISMIDNHWYIIPAALGGFVGTTGTILLEQRYKAQGSHLTQV